MPASVRNANARSVRPARERRLCASRGSLILSLVFLILLVFGLNWPSAAHSAFGSGSYSKLENGESRFWLPDTLETPWTASDKKLHFLACYSIVLTGRVGTDELKTGIIGAVALSVAKELWDVWFKTPASQRGASKRDLVVDAIGIVAAVVVVEWLAD